MKKILFYYCFIISLFISISGILASENVSQLLMQLLFLPVTIYFSYVILVQLIDKKEAPIKNNKINKGALAVTLIVFLLLFFSSISKVIKNPKKIETNNRKVVLTISPKLTDAQKIILKKEFIEDKINVRELPSTDSKIIGLLENKPYIFVNKKDSWFEIIYKDKTHGFVSDKFIKLQ